MQHFIIRLVLKTKTTDGSETFFEDDSFLFGVLNTQSVKENKTGQGSLDVTTDP